MVRQLPKESKFDFFWSAGLVVPDIPDGGRGFTKLRDFITYSPLLPALLLLALSTTRTAVMLIRRVTVFSSGFQHVGQGMA